MANKIFLRVNAWYKSSTKRHASDMDMSEIIEDVSQRYPVIKDDGSGDNGGSVTIPATAYDTNAAALAALGAGALYKSTTLINGSPIILITV